MSDEWRARLDAQLQEYIRRKAEATARRQAMAKRRAHGLRARHRAKLDGAHGAEEVPAHEPRMGRG